jgi:two-component system phosphate regulon sensor histidine kinase PhoR
LLRSIRWRIAIPVVLLIVVCITGLNAYLSHFFEDSYLNNLTQQLANQAILVADSSSHYLSDGQNDGIDALAKRLGEQIDARITIIDTGGEVLGDSEEDPIVMENHSNRPEVIEALAGEIGSSIRYSKTLGYDMLYVAVSIPLDGEISGASRVSLPLTDIHVSLSHINSTILWGALIAIIIAILVAFQISRVTTKPIKRLTQMSRNIAYGDLDQEIQIAARDEIGELSTSFNQMTTKLREMMATLTKERDRMAAILSHMSDGILVVDGDSRVTMVNLAARTMLQLPEDEEIDGTFVEVVRDYELNDIVQRCLSTGEQHFGMVETSQTKYILRAIATPLGDEPGCLILLQDFTELRRLETVRQDFMANISHELRTPLTSLKALADTLQEGAIEDPSVARDFLIKTNSEIDRLNHMVQELGDLSRIESGETTLHKEPVDILKVIMQVEDSLQAQAKRAGININSNASAGLPKTMADRERIEQVLVNLIHNAIKFTPPSGRIDISAIAEGDSIQVSVADTGIGISDDDLPRIFERFYKSDKARTSGAGTGLGLAIAKHIIEAHGGSIWAESVEGKGATFYFTLPLLPQ